MKEAKYKIIIRRKKDNVISKISGAISNMNSFRRFFYRFARDRIATRANEKNIKVANLFENCYIVVRGFNVYFDSIDFYWLDIFKRMDFRINKVGYEAYILRIN